VKKYIQNLLIAKVNAVLIAVAVCFSLFGIQSVGLVHGVVHADLEQHVQSNTVFDGVEKFFGSDPQKSNSVCKLLDSLLLGALAVSEPSNFAFFSFSHIPPLAVIPAGLTLFKFWSYQSQAPPQSDSL